MQKKYIIFIIFIIFTVISSILTIPKVKIVEEYKNKAINPLDKKIVQMDELSRDLWNLTNMQKANNDIKESKSALRTSIELCIFDNSVFSEIFTYVLITSLFYVVLTGQAAWLTIKAFKNYEENVIIKILLIITLLLAIIFGCYFIGILIILIIAVVSGILSLTKA